jgi:hypothetical protein
MTNRLYSWTRDLHLYVGLFSCPFVLLFAISTFLLNHRSELSTPATTSIPAQKNITIEVPDGDGTLEQAKAILRQLNVTGEIDHVRHNVRDRRLVIPVSKPGEITTIAVDLRAKTATVDRQARGLGAALVYLHKKPGPHNVKFRGNWTYMGWWVPIVDVIVYGVLFLTASGLYLWWMFKAERTVGSVLLAAGVSSVTALVIAICTA